MAPTEVTTFTSARGIDGGIVHEDTGWTMTPHEYAMGFVTREYMVGNVDVAARLRHTDEDEYLDWRYTGVWKSIGDEPYRVSLAAEFSEKVDA